MVELGLFQWIIGGICAIGLAVFAYLNGRLTSVHQKHQEFRTHIAENYTTKADVKNIEMQLSHTLDRVHSRMDDIDKSIRELPKHIMEYIKDK